MAEVFTARGRALDLQFLMRRSLKRSLSESELSAYAAPFPSKEYQMGALVFPRACRSAPIIPERTQQPPGHSEAPHAGATRAVALGVG